MSNLFKIWSILVLAALIFLPQNDVVASPTDMMTWMTTRSVSSYEEQEDEFQLDSEFSRRILATTKYISYGALQRNTVPCSKRGASYYNCRTGAQANPYSRGCSAITKCRS